MMDMEEWSEPDEIVTSDIYLSGCGAFSQGSFFHSKFSEFMLRQNLQINALELPTVMVTVKLWGRLYRGLK